MDYNSVGIRREESGELLFECPRSMKKQMEQAITQPGSFTFDTTIQTFFINGVSQTINNTSSIPLQVVGSSACNPLYSIYGGTEQYSSLSLSIENSDTVFGNMIIGIDTNTAGVLTKDGCFTSAQVGIQASLNVTYPTNPNCYSINAQQINQTVSSTFTMG
jgi:hypothetical protein